MKLVFSIIFLVLLSTSQAFATFDKTLSVTGYDITYEIPYSMDKGEITNAILNCEEGSLFLFINSNDDGILKLDIPDNLFSSVFMVLIDGKERIDGISIINDIITINYSKNTKTIEMIAVFALTPDKYDGVCDADTNYVSENKSVGIIDEEDFELKYNAFNKLNSIDDDDPTDYLFIILTIVLVSGTIVLGIVMFKKRK